MRRTCAVVLRFPSRTRARGGCAFARHGHMLKHFLRREGCDCNSFHEPWLENCFITATKNSTGAPFPGGARTYYQRVKGFVSRAARPVPSRHRGGDAAPAAPPPGRETRIHPCRAVPTP